MKGKWGFVLEGMVWIMFMFLNEVVQGRLKEDKVTYASFLDVKKAYDTVWHDGLWFKLWEMGVRGKVWRIIKQMLNF